MKDRAPAIDAHAYVDNCLTSEERKAFEARLRHDEDMRRRVELWRAQGEAIRSAFGAPGRDPRPSSLRVSPAAPPAPPSLVTPIRGESIEPTVRLTARTRTGERAGPKWMSWLRRPATRAAFVLMGVALFPSAMAHAPRDALAETGASAFRAFSASPAAGLDFHNGASSDLARALGPQFLAVRLSEWVTPLGWTLRGAKRVPGLQGEAVLILLEGKEKRPLGVLVEPFDAPASSAIRAESVGGMTVAVFTRRGFGFAVASQVDGSVEAWLSAAGFIDDGWPQPTR